MIDISLWKRDEKSQASGTRSKFWLLEPGTDPDNPTKYLFKIPTEGTGGHWAEFVASKVGYQLGFHTAEVELAEHQGVIGTISKNFRAEIEELYEERFVLGAIRKLRSSFIDVLRVAPYHRTPRCI